MRIRYMRRLAMAAAGLLTAMTAQASYLNDHFDTAPFTNGATFTAGVSNWMASSASVMVTNSFFYTAPHAVILPEGSALSNTVAQTPAGDAWTDFRLAPMLGDAPAAGATNAVSFLCYCASNGFLTVWNGSGWSTCSNDIWNTPVAALTNGVFATISIHQDFAAQRAAILVNDRVVAQDLPFVNSTNGYSYFLAENSDNNAWLDDVWVQTNYDTNRLSANVNGVNGADASELQTYGYVARTFYVGTGGAYAYGTISNALAVARDRDTLYIAGAAYAESVTITQDLTLAGTFTNSGTITVAAGSVVNATSNFVSSLTVSGTVALVQGVVVSGAVVTVAGNGQITVPTNNAQLLAGDLNITSNGTVVATGGQVADAFAGVTLSGGFTLTHTWGTEAASTLDFLEDFERYAANTRLQSLGFAGWGASLPGVVVQASAGYGPSQGVFVPESGLLSNRLATVGVNKIWTDFHLKPAVGDPPTAPETNSTAFLCYVATNGALHVWSAGAWSPCTNFVDGSSVAAITTGNYVRVTVFTSFTNRTTAVFVAGKLARELVGFPAGMSIPSYRSFQAANSDGNAYLDDLRITTGIPGDLLSVNPTNDLDGDETADADEIDRSNSLLTWNGTRTLFKFR